MANAWIEFVKQYAKENNISYARAVKEAKTAYHSTKKIAGKGVEDLPNNLQNEVFKFLDDKSAGRMSSTNLGIRQPDGIMNDLESRKQKAQFSRLMQDYAMLLMQHTITVGTPMRSAVLQRMQDYLDFFKCMQSNPYLSEPQHRTLQEKISSLTNILSRR